VTTPIEDRLRLELREMADEIQPSAPPLGLEHSAAVAARRHAVLAAVAAVAAVVVAVGAVAWLRGQRAGYIEPVDRPPKTFHLAETSSLAPGRSLLAVLPAASTEAERTWHLQPAAGGPPVALATTAWVEVAYSQQLSWDGTRVIRQHDSGADPRLEIVNLDTGAVNELGGRRGLCPQLSPDNRTVAVYDFTKGLVLLDSRSGRMLPRGLIDAEAEGVCSGIGWSPDGELLVVAGTGGSQVYDNRGRPVVRLPDRSSVNSGMSWSPDGESILMYDGNSARYVIRNVSDGSETALTAPAEALRPLGWAGSRVVWLAGQPGHQRLISTDRAGGDPRPWMRIAAGSTPIQTVQWSRDLSGRPEGDGLTR
jgi:hypothetical protein